MSIQVFQCFAQVLHQQPLQEDDNDAAKSELRLFYRNLSHLASFCRAYSEESVDIFTKLQDEIFAEEKVVPVARVVFLTNMRLGLSIETSEHVYDINLFVKKKGAEKESIPLDDKVPGADDTLLPEDSMVE